VIKLKPTLSNLPWKLDFLQIAAFQMSLQVKVATASSSSSSLLSLSSCSLSPAQRLHYNKDRMNVNKNLYIFNKKFFFLLKLWISFVFLIRSHFGLITIFSSLLFVFLRYEKFKFLTSTFEIYLDFCWLTTSFRVSFNIFLLQVF